ncbi:hypothetical protein CK203_089409 [Vitis vinifera]|uniref:Integrase catalytic domain-containing protein n=1 Tax=Vitis vinifera TaxID=29760 RepID=A0A438E937_VITVI|nr:hypothetical protein CK203_089409 [Vitis vinifera]
MVHQGIVLGHIISKQGIEVDKAKVELIVKLPSPTNVKGDAKFIWDDRCQRSFEELKLFLTTHNSEGSNWQLPFEMDSLASRVQSLDQRQEMSGECGVNHLSRLAIAHNSHGLPINDDFLEESLMLVEVAPWYAHIANYLVTGEVPKNSHEGVAIGFLPSLFKYAHTMCKSCDRCQRLGKLTRRNMMPLNPILIVDIFYVWGIDFMRPFPMSFGYSYILVGVDYVSKWVEAVPCKHKWFLSFSKNIFSRFGVPKAIISDGDTHFCNKPFEIS